MLLVRLLALKKRMCSVLGLTELRSEVWNPTPQNPKSCDSPDHLPSRPKLLQKSSLQRECFGAIKFVIITKESLYKANSLACFL